jgi:hypothetical protein
MDDRRKMRASDADRQEVIERLRAALDEGRLKMDEYIDCMGQAKTETARPKLQTSPARPGHTPAHSYPIVSAVAVCLSPDGPQNGWLNRKRCNNRKGSWCANPPAAH